MPSTGPTLVGVIANPASGRDIRRLTAKASVFPTAEKANMVQRMLSAFGALGVDAVLMMPDLTGVAAGVKRALDAHGAVGGMPWPRVEFLDMPITQTAGDTAYATQAMVEAGAKVIAVLGGDGTHRVVAAHCADVPMATLSTGTNNAFPELREATTTGLAAALVATGRVPRAAATRRNKLLVLEGCGRTEVALVDVCITAHEHVGSRALWRGQDLLELYVAFAESDAIGLSSIAGLLRPVSRDAEQGLYLRLAPPHSPGTLATLAAPIGPGLVGEVGVAAIEDLPPGRPVYLRTTTGTIAFDGEREIEISAGDRLVATLAGEGPYTIDVPRTLSWAAAHGVLLRRTGSPECAYAPHRQRVPGDADSAAKPSTKEEMR